MKRVAFSLFFILLFSYEAQACIQVELSDTEKIERKNSFYYVGLVEIVDSTFLGGLNDEKNIDIHDHTKAIPLPGPSYEMQVRLYKDYRTGKNIDKTVKVYSWRNSCTYTPHTEGAIFEAAVYVNPRDEGGYLI